METASNGIERGLLRAALSGNSGSRPILGSTLAVKPLTLTQLAAVARSFGLGTISNAVSAEPGFTMDDVYALETSKGDFILKAIPEQRLLLWKLRQLERELAVLRYLNAAKFRYGVPRPLTNHLGHEALPLFGRLFWTYERLPGNHPTFLSPQVLGEVATALGNYSTLMRGYACADDAGFPATGSLRSELAGVQSAIEARNPSTWDGVEGAVVAGMHTLVAAADFLDGYSFRENPVMSHSDFHPSNLLFDDKYRLIGILDFGAVRPAPSVWDPADAITHYCYDRYTLNIDRRDRFLRRYTQVCPLTAREVEMAGPAILYKYFLETRHFFAATGTKTVEVRKILIERAVGRMRDMVNRLAPAAGRRPAHHPRPLCLDRDGAVQPAPTLVE